MMNNDDLLKEQQELLESFNSQKNQQESKQSEDSQGWQMPAQVLEGDLASSQPDIPELPM